MHRRVVLTAAVASSAARALSGCVGVTTSTGGDAGASDSGVPSDGGAAQDDAGALDSGAGDAGNGGATDGGVVPAWLAAVPLWHWHRIPGTRLSSVTPSPRPPGVAAAQITAWCGAALRRQDSTYLIGAAGGHADYAGNEVNALRLEVDAPQWELLITPSPEAQMLTGSPCYLDQRPAATHTYSASHVIGNHLVVLARGGLSMPNLPTPPANWPYRNDDSYSKVFDLEQRRWEAPDFFARFPAMTSTDYALCFQHPVTQDCYLSGSQGGGWWRFSARDRVWSRQAGGNRSPWYAGAAVDPTRNRVLVVGGYSGNENPLLMTPEGTDLSPTFRGLGPAALRGGGYPGVMYDEANDTFIAITFGMNPETLRVLTCHAGTLETATPTLTGTPPRNRQNGVHNSCQYVPRLKGFVMATEYDDDVFFVRTAA